MPKSTWASDPGSTSIRRNGSAIARFSLRTGGWSAADTACSCMSRPPRRPCGGGTLHPMQEMFREHHALQCGFCTPGMLMTAIDLMQKDIPPTSADVRDALYGNLCRCTGYQHIVEAVLAAMGARAGTSGGVPAVAGDGDD